MLHASLINEDVQNLGKIYTESMHEETDVSSIIAELRELKQTNPEMVQQRIKEYRTQNPGLFKQIVKEFVEQLKEDPSYDTEFDDLDSDEDIRTESRRYVVRKKNIRRK